METQKIINLLRNETTEKSRFRTKFWVEINDERQGVYEATEKIRFKTTMLKSGLYDYGDAYILVEGTITVASTKVTDTSTNNTNKKVTFKNCASFTNRISKINNTQLDNAKDLDIVMPVNNLTEYSRNYAKKSGSLY